MKIYTKARVAICAILDVAIHGASQRVRLADISARQGVSQSYLEQLFRGLVRGGFLASARGPGGGYLLGRRLATASVADIISAVDSADLRRPTVRRSGNEGDITAELWSGLDEYLQEYLRTVSLESVLAGAVEAADLSESEPVVASAPQILGDTRARDGLQSHQGRLT